MQIEIPVSLGELIDKITILEIKLNKLTNPDQLKNVEYELDLLCQKLSSLPQPKELYPLRQQLYTVNKTLWDIENFKRACEREQRFDIDFVQAARNVYIYNDDRARIKREINVLSGSKIIEEKSHTNG